MDKITPSGSDRLRREQQLSRSVFAVFSVLLVSGFGTYLTQTKYLVLQWGYLLHTLAGLVFLPIILFYIAIHFRRTLGQRRPLLLLLGLLAVFLLAAVCWSGLNIAYRGQTETTRWIYTLHVQVALCSVIVMVIHIIGHRLALPDKRRRSEKKAFPGLASDCGKYSLIWVLLSFLLVVILNSVSGMNRNTSSGEPGIIPYEYPYGAHPFRPSQTETTSGTFITPQQIARSETCAHCHPDIAKQWRASAHKQAASDRAYITNISLLAKKKGIAATRYCEGCHAPVALLTGQLTTGGQHGGIEDTAAFNEGVGCLLCHQINKVIHVKGVASYQYDPQQSYLFTNTSHAVLKTIHHFLIRVKPEQHRHDMARKPLRDPKLCATCHAQFMDKDMNDWGWVKMQDEYTAWLQSPYSNQHEHRFANAKPMRCHDCHMPLEKSNDPSANINRKIMSHRFLGANTMLPLLADDAEQLQQTITFLQADKMRITIEEPHRRDAQQTPKSIDETLRSETDQPYYFYLGESVSLTLIVTNIGVGHDFPGGTLDINEAWVALTVTDAQGYPIVERGFIDEALQVDRDAYFYRSLPIDREGKLVWRHDLFNRVGDTDKNSIPAGKSDLVTYRFTVPSWAKGPLTLHAVLKYRKLNQRYAHWALQEEYQPIPVVDMARDVLTVPIREQSAIR